MTKDHFLEIQEKIHYHAFGCRKRLWGVEQ
jgi:hypothetical protein